MTHPKLLQPTIAPDQIKNWTLADWLFLAEVVQQPLIWGWQCWSTKSNSDELAHLSLIQWEGLAQLLELPSEWASVKYKEYCDGSGKNYI
ncbi:MAG: hypothetical protein RMY36_032460 [Nostoc sp. SerVER01]|nr:hypothetical protein [Nostoc sp. SerVER01]